MNNTLQIGQEVFYINDNKLQQKPVTGVFKIGDSLYYTFVSLNWSASLHGAINAERVFATKEELLKSL